PVGSTHCFPARPEEFARFARQAALRYRHGGLIAGLNSSILVWQIWNEANHYPFVQPTVDATFYTEMLKQAYVAIHTADFWTTVVAAGTSTPSGTIRRRSPAIRSWPRPGTRSVRRRRSTTRWRPMVTGRRRCG